MIVKVNIACALRWGVAFVGITLLGMAHPIWDNISGAGSALIGRFSSGAARVKKVGLWICNHFCKMFEVNSF